MAISHGKSKRKSTGKRVKRTKAKKKSVLGRIAIPMTIGDKKKKQVRKRGGKQRPTLQSTSLANVYNPQTKKTQKTEITAVKENNANRHYARRNVVTKGALVETKLGTAKVTSRPGQDGIVNAVLV